MQRKKRDTSEKRRVKQEKEKKEKFEELPERFQLWQQWNLFVWGGELPGRKAILAANTQRRTMARTVDDIPRPETTRLLEGGKEKSGLCWYGERSFSIKPTKNPHPKGSFGFASLAVYVELPKRVNEPAELVITLDDKATRHLVNSTIRLFHWDDKAKRFRLVPMSGADAEAKAAWGRIRESGVYVAVGYPRDPLVRHTLQVMQLLKPYRRAADRLEIEGPLVERICQLILCPPDMWGIPVEATGDEWMGIPQDFSEVPPRRGRDGNSRAFKPTPERAAYLRSICEDCFGHGPGAFGFPEDEIRPEPIPGEAHLCSEWESIGPRNITCVIRALAAHPNHADVLYAAAEAGGVWKTHSGGAVWAPTMDQELNLRVEAVGLCRSQPQVVYAGMSDGVRGSNIDLYRSDDGAASWIRKTEVDSFLTRAIAVHPTDPNIVYLAGERSLHKSEDGGGSWRIQNVTVDGVAKANVAGIFDADINDVKIDPDNPNTLYIAVGGQGIFKSTDGGSTWRRKATGFTFTVLDDLGNAQTVSANGSFRTLLAIGEDDRPGKNGTQFIVAKIQGTILISPDGGDTWRVLPGTDHGLDDQNWWTSCVAVCPSDQDFIVAGGDHIDFTLNASTANPAWNALPDSFHADQQAIAFIPSRPDDFYFANDGYIGKATGRGARVEKISDGLVAGQCFNVAVSQTSALVVGCSTYHTGIIRTGRTAFARWEVIDGPEGGLFEIDPTNENVMFDGPWGSTLRRSNDGGSTWPSIGGTIDVGSTPANPREPYVEAIGIRPDDPRKIYASAFYGRLHFTTDGGNAWDFVRHPDGAPLLIDGDELRDNGAWAFGYAPSNGNVLYVGTKNGRLWRTTTSATTAAGWEELNPPYRTSFNYTIRAIAVHLTDPDRIYLAYAITGARQVWRGVRQASGSFQWTDITGLYASTTLPLFPVDALVIDPLNPRRIFAATNSGVFVTDDEGDWWKSFNKGLPNVRIFDMRLRRRSRTLYVAAYGRGIFQSGI